MTIERELSKLRAATSGFLHSNGVGVVICCPRLGEAGLPARRWRRPSTNGPTDGSKHNGKAECGKQQGRENEQISGILKWTHEKAWSSDRGGREQGGEADKTRGPSRHYPRPHQASPPGAAVTGPQIDQSVEQ